MFNIFHCDLARRAGSTLHCRVVRLDCTRDCIIQACCTGTDHADTRQGCFVNFKDTKRVDYILESLLDFQFFVIHFMSIINNRKSTTILKSSFNSHVYWDTLYVSYISLKTKE